MTLRESAEAHANNEFVDTLMFYFNEETEHTPIEIAKIFIEEYSKVAFELAEEFKERDEESEDWEEPDLEMGYDPYMGCYSDDC